MRTLELKTFVLGPLDNNSYLLFDDVSKEAVVIDPSFDPEPVLEAVTRNGLNLKTILLTHAHFDHIAGTTYLVQMLPARVDLALSSKDALLYKNSGGAGLYGFSLGDLPEITMDLLTIRTLYVGQEPVLVKEVPGHTPGHVLFYVPGLEAAFCGDLIFKGSIGRTDLPGGDTRTILASIRSQVLMLPPETALYPGHGPATTVAEEAAHNPFLS